MMIDDSRINLKNVSVKVREVLRGVADYQRRMRGRVSIKIKEDSTPVTEVDIESQRMIEAGVSNIIPGALFRGEESEWSSWGSDDYCWLVDPLDGTSSYVRGKSGWSISLALLKGNDLIMGFIVDPENNIFYSAIKREGAFRNGTRIRVSYTSSISNSKIITSEQLLGRFANLPKSSILHNIVSFFPGAAMKGALIASGAADGYFNINHRLSPKVWDLAAAAIIVSEAGGKASLINGAAIDFNTDDPEIPEFIISNGLVHNDLLSTVADAYNFFR